VREGWGVWEVRRDGGREGRGRIEKRRDGERERMIEE